VAAAWLPAAPLRAAPDDDDRIAPDRPLRFPRDHGAHPGAGTEWWYATGWLWAEGDAARTPTHGFQLTFFRSRTGLATADAQPGRFVPRQLLFGHAALTDLAVRTHRHAQRIDRWSGDEAQPEAHARRADTAVQLGAWSLRRDAQPNGASRYTAALPAPEAGLDLRLTLDSTQPVLLQGQAGHSRKGPLVAQASHYYSQPQLAVRAQVKAGGQARTLAGTGWLDHEWSDAYLAPEAVGWDWIGINLADGGALMAFVLRRRDGSALWAGGSHRPAGGAVRSFAPDEVQFTAGRTWLSPDTGARYPVQWTIRTPAGVHSLTALLDAQELDSRQSTGAVYWEGLAELRDGAGARVGLGYLEMTGRVAPLKMG
jgi:predicted secreted hydrolase